MISVFEIRNIRVEDSMKKAFLVLFAVVLAAGIVLTGCQKKEQAGQKILVGFAQSNANDTWNSYLHDAFGKEIAKYDGYEVIWSDADFDVTRQQDNVNTMISRGVKALAVMPVDTSATDPITRACREAGVKLVYVNRNPFVGTNPPVGVYYIGSEAIVSGHLQMEELGKHMGGSGDLAILMGPPTQEAAVARTQGVKEIAAEKYPGIRVVAEQTASWMRNDAVTVTENWLTTYPNLRAIAANNDEMALGALVAIESAGRKGILVAGIDGNPDALQAIQDDRLVASVFQDAAGQGAGAADYLIRSLKGENLEPVKWIPYVLITKENLSDYL
jgi:inositol transport system substrate-binding protein